jgi:Holliday junction resolvase
MRAKRVDSNQSDIIQAYLVHGFSVADLSASGDGFPDLVVAKFNINYLVEVKTKTGKLRQSQIDFRSKWRGDYRVVRTVDDVIAHAQEVINKWGRR